MAHPKDKHYWRQLRETLTAGKWEVAFPGRAPNGTQLSWSELLRKFNKHCMGHTDIAELVSQTQALSLLLSANSSDRSLDGDDVNGRNALLLGQECMLPEERCEEAMVGYNALKAIESSNSDSIKLAVAYYEYALRRPAECLATLAQVKVLTDIRIYSGASGTVRSNANATSLTIPGTMSDGSVSSTWTGSIATALSTASIADISDGSTWAVTESIRSICLQGMSHEVISPDHPQTAFDTYLTATQLIGYVASEVPASTPQKASPIPSSATDFNSFLRYRELWRWVERLLRRAIILGSRLCDVRRAEQDGGVLWNIFNQYHTCSGYWPPTFRPELRSTIAVLHLRAFVLRFGRSSQEHPSGNEKCHQWISTARSVIHEYRAILSVSTQFPAAGQRNVKVEDLVDLCVAIWEADGAVGEFSGWVIDVLWWATRLTFNSYRVFRHMSRLLYVSGDPELAKRTLRLYVQVVSKAREAGLGDSDGRDAIVGGDIDTDRNWVQTLVQGGRMLSRLAMSEENCSKAIEEAKEAGVMIEKAKLLLDAEDKELVGSVQLAEGIWNAVMANIERDPRTRSTYFDRSLDRLLESLESFPTPSVHYHLALAYGRPGPSQDLQTAIGHARSAVEGDPNVIRHWHLLGLLLTATGDWKAARGVLEVGAGVGEADLVDDATEAEDSTRPNGVNGVHAQDFAISTPEQSPRLTVNGETNGHLRNGHANTSTAQDDNHPISLLTRDATTIPPSTTLLLLLPDHPPPSRQELFEHALQLRMTQITLAEYVEGPEGAGDRWVEVFQWFSEKREAGMDDRRMSIDSRRVSDEFRPPSILSGEKQVSPRVGDRSMLTIPSSADVHVDHILTPSTPIPITITPASPGLQSPVFSVDSSAALPPEVAEEIPDEKRRMSSESNHRDMSRGKKVKQVLKSRVSKGQARITTISRKIGHNVGRHSNLHIKRSNSAPDLHAVLSHAPYQASSIHLRQHLSIYASQQDLSLLQPPPPPPLPPPPPPPQSSTLTTYKQKHRAAKDRRLLSNLWLMSAATFRRLGKIEQARAAIQEAEVKDENNPAVWVQLGLYYMALGNERRALEAFQKALFISPDEISATIHLCRLYLPSTSIPSQQNVVVESTRDNVDLAVGLLSELTRGVAWDVPEAWYVLAKHYGLQGRKGLERECLSFALTLSETRGLRDIGVAVGWCL